MTRILVVEDQRSLLRNLVRGLEEEGYEVIPAASVSEARVALARQPDVFVLDLMLPDGSGVELLRKLRGEGLRQPILILTARDSVDDRVEGLDAGADDYLVKPFSFNELLARLRALLRRGSLEQQAILRVEGLEIDRLRRVATRNGLSLELSNRQFELLSYLMQHAARRRQPGNDCARRVERIDGNVDQRHRGEYCPTSAEDRTTRLAFASAHRPGPGISVGEDFMSRLPIRWQFTLWFGATLALLLFGFSLLLFAVMRHQLLAAVDAGLQEELREITNEISLARKLPEMLEQTQRRFLEHGVYHFQMVDTAGRVLFQSRAFDGRPPLSLPVAAAGRLQFDMRDLPGLGPCRVVTSVVDGPGGRYVVHAATSLGPFERQLSLLITVLVASGPIALACGIAGGYTLARRALSPVDRIVDVANRITATDLHQRVDVLNPNDELGRLAQTFNALIDRLQKAIEEMRRFTADAAHELRTPLAVLRSGIDVTLRAPRTAQEYRQALEAAADEANRLTRLADQLLFLSRQAAGMMQIDREEMRLDALVKDVAEQFASRTDEAGVALTVEPLEPWTVRGDDIRLSQVFYNVLENAIKYTPRGGRVTVRGRAVDHRVEIEVEDTGLGIPPEHLPHVFKRFYRVEQSRSAERGGSGLGLAIAQSAIEAHGGTISIKSTPGRGTVVSLSLPGQLTGSKAGN